MYSLVVEGKIANPDGTIEAQIGIEDGLVREIKKQGLKGETKIVVRDGLIFPGFMDPHVHLREDSSHKWDYKEDFQSGSKAAAHGGVTTVVDMPNNFLPSISEDRILEKMRLTKKSVIEVLFHGGVSNDSIGEIKKISRHVVGLKVYLSETTGELKISDRIIENALSEIAKTGLTSVFHINETSDSLKNLLALTNKLNVKSHIAHVSKSSTLEFLKNIKMTYEVTPHHILFDEKDVNKIKFLTMNPPIGSKNDRTSILNALKAGAVYSMATDHAPHSIEDKENGAKGLPSLDIYGNMVAWLIKELKLDPSYVSKLTSFNAAKIFNLKGRGEIKEGFDANISILQFKSNKIKLEEQFTKCGWSPYVGMTFPGKITYTIFNGSIIYEDG